MNEKHLPGERRGLFPGWRREPLAALRDEMESLLERFWGEGDRWLGGMRMLNPSLDLEETDNTIEARLDLPGVKPEDIDIRVSGNVLTVSGRRQEQEEKKDRRFHHLERRTGSFSRSITLPCSVSESEVSATYRDGVLAITMPKVETAKSRKVEVKTDSPPA